jgi:peptidoglycan/xylan/chitin deacetylase (PgdA/CDA1 family)
MVIGSSPLPITIYPHGSRVRIPGLKKLRQGGRWLRSRFAGGALILGYHRVADARHDPGAMCVSPRHFAEQLEVVRSCARPVSLAELVSCLDSGRLPPRLVAVTFDDGYADNLSHALPLLERFEAPATLFIATGYTGRSFDWEDGGEDSRPPPRALTAAEIGGLAQWPLLEIGAHSVRHPFLARLSGQEQQTEIEQSKVFLEEVIGQRVNGFSYPNSSYTIQTMALVQQAGFRYACAGGNNVAQAGAGRFDLPRFWIPDCDGDAFGAWLRHWLC